MFFDFLVSLLHLGESDVASCYYPWYEADGQALCVIIPLCSSLLFVLLFYYGWSRIRAVTTGHWFLAGLVNVIVTFFLNLFIGKSALSGFVRRLGDDYQDTWYAIVTWPYTLDLWFFALNGVIWALVFYFILSLIFKSWSPVWNIPFGRKYKKSRN